MIKDEMEKTHGWCAVVCSSDPERVLTVPSRTWGVHAGFHAEESMRSA